MTWLLDFLYRQSSTSIIDKVIAQNIVPAISYTTLTSGFNFIDRDVLKQHASVFIGAIASSFVYGLAFLKPINFKEICIGGEVQNENPTFKYFKNMFILGQMVIGIVVVLAYICLFGGRKGVNLVVSILVILAIVYFIIYVIADKSSNQDNDLVEYM
jgi:hypothetical protein